MSQLTGPQLVTGTGQLRRRHDVRLVPVALTMWLGTLLGIMTGWISTLLSAVAAFLVGVTLLLWARSRCPHWIAGAIALILASLALGAVTVSRLWRIEHDPVRTHVMRGGDIAAWATVNERPRPIRAPGYAGAQAGARSVAVTAELKSIVVGGEAVESSGQIVLIAPFTEWSTLLPGQRFTAKGKLTPSQDSGITVATVFVRGPPENVSPAPWWQRAADAVRQEFHRTAAAVLAEEPAGLLPGLVVGDTSTLSARVDREFKAAGLSHLLAVSGSNVVIVCGSVLLLCRLCRIGPRMSAVVAGIALTGFVVLVGPEPSVLRAGVMGALGLLALALGRNGSALPALATAVAVLVFLDAELAVSFGFALSVLATAGLVLLAPRWTARLSRRGSPPGIAAALAVPVVAFLATAPVIAGMAGQISMFTVVANLLATPVVAPATIFGMLGVVCALWWPAASELFIRLSEVELDWLILIARHTATMPGAVLPWPSGWWGAALAVVAVGMVVLAVRFRFSRYVVVALLCAVLLVLVPVKVIRPGWPPPNWSAIACDVGQGDALVLATGEPGRAVVVDAGPEPGPIDECLDRLDIDRVPLVILSHLHADHIGGVESLFAGRKIGAIAVGPGRSPGWAWQQVARLSESQRVPLVELAVHDRLTWPSLTITVLGPRYVPAEGRDSQEGTGINNASVVLRANTAAGDMLLTGDVELAAQADLLASGVDLRADVLKVPHHGSRYSLPQFVAAVAPRIAMISVGAGNRYGHPSPTTLDVLTANNALIARTDRDGDSALVADPQGPTLSRRGR